MFLINREGQELALHRNDVGDNLMIVTVRVARSGKKKDERARVRTRINFDIRTERERRREFADLSIVVLRTAARTLASATPFVLYDIGQDRATRLFNRCIMQIDITAPLRMQ